MSVFQLFDYENDVVENQKTKISSGIFSGGSGTMTAFFTSSTQQATGSFLSVYNQDPNPGGSPETAEVQFDVGYAHKEGSGSAGNVTKLTTGGRESAAMYKQFAKVVLPIPGGPSKPKQYPFDSPFIHCAIILIISFFAIV